jgi:GntR family transcriptional regulator, transcriptional repressor for pyruvate dehydrogenase complex
MAARASRRKKTVMGPAHAVAAGQASSLVQQTVHRIAAIIRDEALSVGDQLPSEGALVDALSVSRTVVREAVRALAALGIVDVGNGRKPRVAAATAFPFIMALTHSAQTGQITVQQIWEARSCIEVKTATLAAGFRTDAQSTRLLELANRMRDCEDRGQEMAALEIEFHQLIAAASRNILFEHLLASFAPLMATAVPAAWSTRSTPAEEEEVIENHLGIAIAIAEKNVRAAAKAMERHFDRAIGYLVKAQYQLPGNAR